MSNQLETDSPLGSIRVLELGDEKGMMCGKILGDLGADVIKIEPPCGDPVRNIGPFYKDIPDPEKSLFWFAFNTNKRGVTLNLETSDGREILDGLIKGADLVLEAFPPGYMESLGLGYSRLAEVKKDIIVTSISPFGQGGPYAHYSASDLTAWAMSGFLYLSGDPDRPPNWISFPQAFLHAGAEAAVGSMIALWHHEVSGEGQQVDVSVQASCVRLMMSAMPYWDLMKVNSRRIGYALKAATVDFRVGWPCKDGYIGTYVMGGGAVSMVKSTRAWVKWMGEEGMAPAWLRDFDWVNDYDAMKLTPEFAERVNEPFLKFFMTKTKAELYEGGVRRGIIIVPVSTAEDLWQDSQLRTREFWVEAEHPELGDVLSYCGPFIKLSGVPGRVLRRAPLIGEHNEEIYVGEIGLSKSDLIVLTQSGVI